MYLIPPAGQDYQYMYILLKLYKKNNSFIQFSQIITVQLFHFKASMFCVIMENSESAYLTNDNLHRGWFCHGEDILEKGRHFTDVF